MGKYALLLIVLLSHYLMPARGKIPQVQIPFEWLGVKEGLSQGYISGILQDKEGFMWFATSDGLNKYDGYKVSVFQTDPREAFSLPDNMITGIVEDDNGNFWVATNHKGLLLFDKRKEQFHTVKLEGLDAHTGVLSLHYQNRELFVSTVSNALLYAIRPLKTPGQASPIGQQVGLLFNYNALPISRRYPIGSSNPNHMMWVPGHHLWMMNDDTLIQFIPDKHRNSWTNQGYCLDQMGIGSDKPVNRLILPVHHDPNCLYFLQGPLIHLYDTRKGKVVKTISLYEPDKPAADFYMFGLTPNGDILSATTDSVYHYDTRHDKLVSWQNRNVLTGIICNNSYTSRDGINWYCTSGYGVLKSDPRKQWFHPVYTTDNTSRIRIPTDISTEELPNAVIEWKGNVLGAAVMDQQGVYWSHTNTSALVCYHPLSRQLHHFPNTKIHPFRQRIFSDQLNRLWIGADNGLNRQYLHLIHKAHGTIAASYKIPVGRVNNPVAFVRDLYSDPQGIVYLATENGLYRLDTRMKDSLRQWQVFQHQDTDPASLSSNSLWCLCPDPVYPSKYLWIGTSGSGLNRLDLATGKCIQITRQQGLPNNVIYGILPDKQHNLWMSTNKGLCCYNPYTQTLQTFTSEDGLPTDEFNHFEYHAFKNGDLFFGGVNGHTRFNPQAVLQNDANAPLMFTGLSVSNREIDWKKNPDVLDAPIAYAKQITLRPGQNMFTISFASLEYRSNQKKFYTCRLQGFENKWTTPSNKNEITYTNLSPGRYTLYVKGTQSNGVWKTRGHQICLNILPAWYQTWWFRVMILSAVLLVLYSLYRFRLQQQLKVFRVRSRIASDLHDEVGSTLSSITMFSEAARVMNPRQANLGIIIDKIHSSAHEALESMGDIVWAVNTQNDQLYHLLNRMRNFAIHLSEVKGFTLHLFDNKDLPDIPLDIDQRKNIYLIVKEALNNAAKYSQASNLWLQVVYENKYLHLTIRDDGIGFHPELVDQQGAGNGLLNMKKRAADIGASLHLQSAPDQGTTISLRLKLKG